MKLLVCAYDCRPGADSGAGWNWVQAFLRLGYQVHVISSRRYKRGPIRESSGLSGDLVVHYCDVPAWARRWHRNPIGRYFHALLWQWFAYDFARELHALERFDRVHQVCPGHLHQPSFMGRLGIPFVFGPVSAGDAAPPALMRKLSMRQRFSQGWRKAADAALRLDPFMRATFSRAQMIACTTVGTMRRIPPAYRSRCAVQIGSGIHEEEIAPAPLYDDAAPNFVFSGELIHDNGLHLALEALAQVRRSVPGARLRVIGTGPDSQWLQDRAREAGVSAAIEWIGDASPDHRAKVLHDSVALVFPSLCDAEGAQVREALAAALPVVCLDLGAPYVLVTADCACIVKTQDADETQVVSALADAMILLATNSQLRTRLGAQALQRARQLTWERAARAVCGGFEPLKRAA